MTGIDQMTGELVTFTLDRLVYAVGCVGLLGGDGAVTCWSAVALDAGNERLPAFG